MRELDLEHGDEFGFDADGVLAASSSLLQPLACLELGAIVSYRAGSKLVVDRHVRLRVALQVAVVRLSEMVAGQVKVVGLRARVRLRDRLFCFGAVRRAMRNFVMLWSHLARSLVPNALHDALLRGSVRLVQHIVVRATCCIARIYEVCFPRASLFELSILDFVRVTGR